MYAALNKITFNLFPSILWSSSFFSSFFEESINIWLHKSNTWLRKSRSLCVLSGSANVLNWISAMLYLTFHFQDSFLLLLFRLFFSTLSFNKVQECSASSAYFRNPLVSLASVTWFRAEIEKKLLNFPTFSFQHALSRNVHLVVEECTEKK